MLLRMLSKRQYKIKNSLDSLYQRWGCCRLLATNTNAIFFTTVAPPIFKCLWKRERTTVHYGTRITAVALARIKIATSVETQYGSIMMTMENKEFDQTLDAVQYQLQQAYKKGFSEGQKEALQKQNAYWVGYYQALNLIKREIEKMDVNKVLTPTTKKFDVMDY